MLVFAFLTHEAAEANKGAQNENRNEARNFFLGSFLEQRNANFSLSYKVIFPSLIFFTGKA